MSETSPELVDHLLQLTLIKAIKESPLRLTILEKWERKAFRGLNHAVRQLQLPKHQIDVTVEDDMYYIGLDSGIMFADTYQLILQVAREQGYVIICAYPTDLAGRVWSG